jgi:hypothetical protein
VSCRHACTVLAAAIAVAGGCSWTTFDDLQNRTPVRVIGAPSGFPSTNDFGRVMIATSPPVDGSAAARAIVSSSQETGIAVLDFDVHGQVTGQTITADALTALGSLPVTAMAEVPGANAVLLGSPSAVGGNVLSMSLESPFTTTVFVSSASTSTGPGDPGFGLGVAAGNLGGGAAAERVVLSQTKLYVYADGQTAALPAVVDDGSGAAPCPIYFPSSAANQLNRAVTIANLQATGPQVVVGTPSVIPTSPGHVSIFNVDVTGGTISCSLALSEADSGFGQAIAVGDFDGDGQSDLLVGAPPSRAYLFHGPVLAGATPTVITAANGLSFGAALAAFDLDGFRGDEAFLADRDATVGGQSNAGQVDINTGPTLGMKGTPPVLVDRNAGSGEAYGSTVVALPFCGAPEGAGTDGGADAGRDGGADAGTAGARDAGAGCEIVRLPLIGSASKLFVYYSLGPTDPRAR